MKITKSIANMINSYMKAPKIQTPKKRFREESDSYSPNRKQKSSLKTRSESTFSDSKEAIQLSKTEKVKRPRTNTSFSYSDSPNKKQKSSLTTRSESTFSDSKEAIQLPKTEEFKRPRTNTSLSTKKPNSQHELFEKAQREITTLELYLSAKTLPDHTELERKFNTIAETYKNYFHQTVRLASENPTGDIEAHKKNVQALTRQIINLSSKLPQSYRIELINKGREHDQIEYKKRQILRDKIKDRKDSDLIMECIFRYTEIGSVISDHLLDYLGEIGANNEITEGKKTLINELFSYTTEDTMTSSIKDQGSRGPQTI